MYCIDLNQLNDLPNDIDLLQTSLLDLNSQLKFNEEKLLNLENQINLKNEYILDLENQINLLNKFNKNTDNIVNENNWMDEFIKDANSRGLFNFKIIPSVHMSKFIKYYLNENNESMLIPSTQTINNKLEPLMKKYGYKLSAKDKTLGSDCIPKLEYNQEFIENEIYENIKLSERSTSRYWINDKPIITDKDITNFEENYMKLDYKKIDLKNKIIARYLVELGDMDIISWIDLTT